MTTIDVTLVLQEVHEEILFDDTRFKVINAGRGFLKTGLLLAEAVKDLEIQYTDIYGNPLANRIWYTAPTYRQGKEIVWDRAKKQLEPITVGRPNETELSIPLINDAEFVIKGSDKPDSLRGPYLTKFLGDEYAFHKPNYWGKIIRPMLGKVKPLGSSTFASTPDGFNEFYDFRKRGDDPTKKYWKGWTFPSIAGGFLTAEEIEDAKEDLDDDTWRQEYMAEFVGMSGRVCKSWSNANIDEHIKYEPNLTLYLTCDFNIDPMCWMVAHRILNAAGKTEYHFVDELCLENTNIIRGAEEFMRRYKKHPGNIIITGDATGKNRSDTAPNPNDTKYKILAKELSDNGMRNIDLDLMTGNPHGDLRIETWNSLVCSSKGIRRVKVHPRCKRLIWNMENLHYIEGTSVIWLPSPADIKRDKNLKFTEHPFDAASYLTYRYDAIKRDVQRKPTSIITDQRFQPSRNLYG